MGLGFVVLIWFFFGASLAVVLSIIFVLVSFFRSRKERDGSPWKRFFLIGSAPFLFLFYFLVMFVIYAIWCFSFRQVDPGIGDGWSVPIANGYRIEMIDVPDKAWIYDQKGHDILSGVLLVRQEGSYLFGKSENGYFFLKTASGELEYPISIQRIEAVQNSAGIMETKLFQTVNEFYMNKRWTWLDGLALILIFFPALVGSFFFGKFFFNKEIRKI